MRRILAFSVAAAALPGVASAAGGAAVDAAAADQDTIIVNGRDDGYAPIETTTATRTPTPLLDVPQAVSVVTRELIDDQAMRSIADVLRGVPGVSIGQGEGNRDQVTLRGNSSTADFFLDGVRDDVQYYRGLYNVERVEVLKGPNAMIFGRGGGGGVINRVQKSPEYTAFAKAAASLDSFGAWYGEADANQPLSERAAVRLNAVYEHGETHRDLYEVERWAVNPTAAFELGESTKLGLSYEYADDERVSDRGVPSLSDGDPTTVDEPVRGFRDAFFGVPGLNVVDFDAHVFRGRLDHDFGGGLSFGAKLVYGDYDKMYRNAFTSGAAMDGLVEVSAYTNTTDRRNLFSQNDFVWEGATGGVKHVVLAGFEYGNQDSLSRHVNGFFDSGVPTTDDGRRTIVPLIDPFVVPAITFRAGAGERDASSDAEVLAGYVQDQLSFGDRFDLIAGLRYDHFRLRVRDRLAGATFARTDSLWSPRLGAVVKPIESLSLYASWSRSFLPQSGDQFSSLDPTTEALKPERFENLELGVKWAIRDALTFTAAAYRLDRTNTRAVDPVTNLTVLTGEQRSKGIELSLVGRIAPNWQLSAGYALQDAEITETTRSAPAGREVPLTPKHQLSLWSRYDFSDAIGLGLGVRHQSRSFASISNAVAIPAYTRVDAALFLRLSEAVEAQVNVENLLDERYFPTAHNDNNISTGAPLNARATVRVRF